jgi:hypothetical protein
MWLRSHRAPALQASPGQAWRWSSTSIPRTWISRLCSMPSSTSLTPTKAARWSPTRCFELCTASPSLADADVQSRIQVGLGWEKDCAERTHAVCVRSSRVSSRRCRLTAPSRRVTCSTCSTNVTRCDALGTRHLCACDAAAGSRHASRHAFHGGSRGGARASP